MPTRRLLPALPVVGAAGALWPPPQAARLRGDVVAALGYVGIHYDKKGAALHFSRLLPRLLAAAPA